MKKSTDFKELKTINESSFETARTIENYLDRIRLKSKGTVKNTGSHLGSIYNARVRPSN